MFGIQITCNYCTRRHNGDLPALDKIKQLYGKDFVRDGKVMMRLKYSGDCFDCKCVVCGQYMSLRVDKERMMLTKGNKIKPNGLYLKHKFNKRVYGGAA